jgi:hypothetical protein
MKLDWQTLLTDTGSRFPKTLYFEMEGAQSFRYGVNETGGFCLFFAFGSDRGNRNIDPIELAKITLKEEQFDHQPTLVLTLLDPTLLSQFTDLILNIVSEVLADKGDHKAKFIQICNEWFELFEPASGMLNRLELQGIFAEMTFLKYLLQNSTFNPNDILLSWTGPFGKGHDFELGNNNNFEIKSVNDGAALVHISSEFQLDGFNGQRLVLVVSRFVSSPPDGSNIRELTDDIHNLLKSKTGVRMNLFWNALSKTGLVISALETYDSHIFQINATSAYDCSDLSFPAIKRTGMSDTIRNVKYDLALPDLNGFLLNDLSELL